MKRTMVGANCSISAESPAETTSPKILRLVLLAILAVTTSPALHAQATGSFSGNVHDKSGSAVPGATVVATSQATGLARDGKTDISGHYLIPLLPVGLYTVRVDVAGFQSAKNVDLNLDVNQAR